MQAEAIRLFIRRPARPLAVSLVLLVVGVSIALALWLVTRDQATLPSGGAMTTFELEELGIAIDYPSQWQLQPFDEDLGMAHHTGAVISNVRHRFVHPYPGRSSSTSAWNMQGLPEGLIVLSFQQLDRHNFEARRNQGFPLSLENAILSHDAEEGIDTYGAPQPRYFIPFAVEGHLGSGVQVYIGDVGPKERTAVERILASVEPISGDGD